MALSRLGARLDLPLDAIDDYFVLDNLLSHSSDATVRSSLEAFRMACTNLPVSREAVESTRAALIDVMAKSPNDTVRDAWGRVGGIQSSKRTHNTPITGSYRDKSCYVQSQMQEIVPGLFLGSYHPANDKVLLKSRNITHVVCCINVSARFPDAFKYLILGAEDSSSYSIRPFFEQTFDFIESAISNGGGVLVHCGAGISRAPTIACAYLMRRLGITALYAMQLVASIRTCACPNMGFRKQLGSYEAELSAVGGGSANQPVPPMGGGPLLDAATVYTL